jgi:hypothetical protein
MDEGMNQHKAYLGEKVVSENEYRSAILFEPQCPLG